MPCRRSLHVAFCIALIAGFAFLLSLRDAFAQNDYVLADSAAVQKLPDRQGGLMGMKTAVPHTVALRDGKSVVVYQVERIDMRARPPFGIGDVLYAVNGVLFTSPDGMPRYVQSLPPGSTTTVEYLQAPPRRWHGRKVPLEQRPSLAATVQIISTPSRYARPPGPPPTPEEIARERRHVAIMFVKGLAVGAGLQAILDIIGLGPNAALPLMAPAPAIRDTGLTHNQQKRIGEDRTPKAESSGGFKTPQQFPEVYGPISK